MAARNFPLLGSNSPASSSDNSTIILPAHSQMRMPAAMAKKPALLQIGATVPMLRAALERKYDYYALGEQEDEQAFLAQKGPSIRGVVTCTCPDCATTVDVDNELASKLPNLEIVLSFDHFDVKNAVDVHLCKKLGVHVTDTRDALLHSTAAATALRLLMAVSREVVHAGRYVRACRWPAEGDYPITFREKNMQSGLYLVGTYDPNGIINEHRHSSINVVLRAI